jgi:FtsP/CotA-like multicopper oxidase with cupredoxin domain
MYTGTADADLGLASILFPVWLLAALLAGHAATRRTGRRVRRTARLAVIIAAVGLLLVAARVVTVGIMASFGWIFVVDRKVITLALILAPALVVPFGMVRLRRAARAVSADPAEPVPPAARSALAAPGVVLPFQITAFAAGVGFIENFLPPVGGRVAKVLLIGGALVLIAVLLLLRANRRSARLAAPNARLRTSGRQWLVRLGVTVIVLGLVSGGFVYAASVSKLPETFSMAHGNPDFGGGDAVAMPHLGSHQGSAVDAGATSVVELRGPKEGKPDRSFTLTARERQVRLSSGASVAAWAFNDQLPGPELRAKEGELVEITLVNQLPTQPATIHWHGLDVPNGEDGVAGVTQDAVAPGQSFTYRFRLEESGTRWYHSHQAASEQVIRGLFGALVIEPKSGATAVDVDRSVVLHDWETDRGLLPAFGTSDTLERQQVPAGKTVRLRLVNSSNVAKTVALTGVPFRVTATDGTPVNAPGELRDTKLVLPSAGRYDVEFTQPSAPVRLVDSAAPGAGIAFSPDGNGEVAPNLDGPEFDLATYGRPASTPFNADSRYDRKFDLLLDEQFGFYNGEFTARKTVNGHTFPDTPMHVVREGELIRMRFTSRDTEDHPMHLHGHHFLVLTKNGQPVTGSPIWLDTINVRPGETWEVGFRADNPGVWMDHCHNFKHTKLGMVLHLAYENVTTPYQVGGPTHNHPD